MADEIDDDDDHAVEPPMIPSFLANMTDDQRKTFVARFNSAKVTSVESIGENGAIVEYELVTNDGQDVGIEPKSFVALNVRPYLNNEGKVSR